MLSSRSVHHSLIQSGLDDEIKVHDVEALLSTLNQDLIILKFLRPQFSRVPSMIAQDSQFLSQRIRY